MFPDLQNLADLEDKRNRPFGVARGVVPVGRRFRTERKRRVRLCRVGGGRTVKMESLRELFESLGFSKVATFIASGNVVFEATTKNVKLLAAFFGIVSLLVGLIALSEAKKEAN